MGNYKGQKQLHSLTQAPDGTEALMESGVLGLPPS